MEFCGTNNCLYGDCDIGPIQVQPTPSPAIDSLPFWWRGNSTDGRCGPANDYKVCNVVWGFCCASSGKCGDGAQFCDSGCQVGYRNCSTLAATPPRSGEPTRGESLTPLLCFVALLKILNLHQMAHAVGATASRVKDLALGTAARILAFAEVQTLIAKVVARRLS